MSDPRVLARGETAQLRHPRFGEVDGAYGPGVPIRFSDLDVELGIPPRLGEHDGLVYRQVAGYSPERIESLRASGVIGPDRSA